MPLRLVTFFIAGIVLSVSAFVYRWWLGLVADQEPGFVRKYGILKSPVDLRARPGAGFYSIVFRRYREVASERVRRKGDLLFVMLVVGVICAILTAVLPDTVWLG